MRMPAILAITQTNALTGIPMTKPSDFKVIDATPPANLPKMLLVMDDDPDFNKRNPGKGFYIHLRKENNDVDFVNIEDCYSLPDAVNKAIMLGYDVQHWMQTSSGIAYAIPTSIVRHYPNSTN
jgi:hypothetical protein